MRAILFFSLLLHFVCCREQSKRNFSHCSRRSWLIKMQKYFAPKSSACLLVRLKTRVGKKENLNEFQTGIFYILRCQIWISNLVYFTEFFQIVFGSISSLLF